MVVLISDDVWERLEGSNRSSKFDDLWFALLQGKAVFVPVGTNKNTTSTQLYQRAKREKVKISLRSYQMDGADGFAAKIVGKRD